MALEDEPNGLLAVGGNLDTETLVNAYSNGIFPWFSPGEPILWWSPSPRMALIPEQAHFSRSLKKLAKKRSFTVTVDSAFDDVVQQCALVPRKDQEGTWISDEMMQAYGALHQAGLAHSIEVWRESRLVGGLYGVSLGRVFFGESMFSLESGTSKLAFSSLCKQLEQWGFKLIDCQVYTPLLASFGALEIEREEFEAQLASAICEGDNFNWQQKWSLSEWGFDGHT